jgi:hypothetical protein
MDTLSGYVKMMMRMSTMRMWPMGKTITITRSETMVDGTNRLLNMMKIKRHLNMEKKSLIYQVEKTTLTLRRRFVLPCGTLMFKNCFRRRRVPLELLLERN